MALLKALLLGGGNAFVLIAILALPLILSNLHAVELDTICPNPTSSNCDNSTTTTNQSVESSKDFALVDDKKIIFNSPLGSFTNRGTITELREGNASGALIEFSQLGSFTNRGTISVDIVFKNSNSRVENYGTMGTISITSGKVSILNVGIMGEIKEINSYDEQVTLDYRSICKTNCRVGVNSLVLQNYGLQITRTANDFNTDKNDSKDNLGNNISNSHIFMGSTRASFYDASSKIILDFGGNFEFGKEYSLNSIALGNNNSPLPVDFYRLTLHNPDIYRLTQNGEYFIVNELSGGEIHAPITESNKNNVVVMNNFFLQSNFVIYRQKIGAQKLSKRKRTPQRRVIRKKVSLFRHSESLGLDSSLRASHYAQNDGESGHFAKNDGWANPLKSNETFFYDSPSYLANNNQRQTRNMRTRTINTTNQSANPSAKSNANRATQSTQSDKYYFILTPYVNHNLYFKAGNYNLLRFKWRIYQRI